MSIALAPAGCAGAATRLRALAFVLGAGLALGACGTLDDAWASLDDAWGSIFEDDTPVPQYRSAPRGAALPPAAVPQASRVTPRVAPRVAPNVAPSETQHLIGVNREAIAAMLGPASFVRRDGPTEMWRYSAADCFLDLFINTDGTSGWVAHVQARSRPSANAGGPNAGAANTTPGRPDTADPAACYRRVVDERRARVAS